MADTASIHSLDTSINDNDDSDDVDHHHHHRRRRCISVIHSSIPPRLATSPLASDTSSPLLDVACSHLCTH